MCKSMCNWKPTASIHLLDLCLCIDLRPKFCSFVVFSVHVNSMSKNARTTFSVQKVAISYTQIQSVSTATPFVSARHDIVFCTLFSRQWHCWRHRYSTGTYHWGDRSRRGPPIGVFPPAAYSLALRKISSSRNYVFTKLIQSHTAIRYRLTGEVLPGRYRTVVHNKLVYIMECVLSYTNNGRYSAWGFDSTLCRESYIQIRHFGNKKQESWDNVSRDFFHSKTTCAVGRNTPLNLSQDEQQRSKKHASRGHK